MVLMIGCGAVATGITPLEFATPIYAEGSDLVKKICSKRGIGRVKYNYPNRVK
jgi:hypothetical protein